MTSSGGLSSSGLPGLSTSIFSSPYTTMTAYEDGFHSASSADQSPSYLDRITQDMNSLGLTENRFFFGNPISKCTSDSGASTGDNEFPYMMKEDCCVLSSGVIGGGLTTGSSNGNVNVGNGTNSSPVSGGSVGSGVLNGNGTGSTSAVWSQQPGSWFYEMGTDDNNSRGSPSGEQDEMALMRAVFGFRNVTESVDVPSSEHVAEIVGRQGCKIKALRAKTNTYIKTPVRGEEPVFVVTGRPEDVLEAKKEIECAAEHFTQIRASRRHSQGTSRSTSPPLSLLTNVPSLFNFSTLSCPSPRSYSPALTPPPVPLISVPYVDSLNHPYSQQLHSQAPIDCFGYSLPQPLVSVVEPLTDKDLHNRGQPMPGHVTKYVRVPLRVVGLVVGPKGATIKRIQQDTHTYIITPSREREPIFEVTGLPANVEAARKEIEQHIYQRTGNMPITDPHQTASSVTPAASATLSSVSNHNHSSHYSDTIQNQSQTSLNNVLSGLSLDRFIAELILAQQQFST